MKTETAKKLIELEIKNLHYAIETANKIMPVIEKFNGKQPNKRLDTALKQIDRNLSFKTRYNSFVISLYLENRHVQDGPGKAAYIQDSFKNIIHASIKSGYGEGICQKDVINAELLKNEIMALVEHNRKLVEKMRAEINHLETIIAEYEAIKKSQSDFQNSVSYFTREYLGLKF